MNNGLSFIDSEIYKLSDLCLTRDLVTINLHSNKITVIDGLGHLVNLTHLDLSANLISCMRGLDGLLSLKVLNLSCNKIKKVENLQSLRSLKQLDLSFNEIEDLTGFQAVKRNTHNIQKVYLFGNNITSLSHATRCLLGCGKLQILSFAHGNDINPICRLPAYRQHILHQLPWILVLDRVKKDGTLYEDKLDIEGIPGIEDYLELLVTSTASVTETSIDSIKDTPKLDAALTKYKSVVSRADKRVSSDVVDKKDESDITARLQAIESHISKLVDNYGQKKHTKEPTVTVTLSSTSEEDSTPEKLMADVGRNKRNPLPRGETIVPGPGKRDNGVRIQDKRTVKKGTVGSVRKNNVLSKTKKQTTESILSGKNVRDPRDDEEYLALMQELENERERRWKSEQASRKLVDEIKQLQEQLAEERKVGEAAIAATAKLRQGLASEREGRESLEKAVSGLEQENQELKSSLAQLKAFDEENRRSLRAIEDTAIKVERQRLEDQTLKAQQLQEAQAKAAAASHEAELLRSSSKELREQIQQLQALLADREHEHRKQIDGMVHLDSKAYQDRIERELAKQEGRLSQVTKQYIDRLAERDRDYADLENEFRLALQIEARRFGELQESFDQVNKQLIGKTQLLDEISQKEKKASSLVHELTALIKEQKGRLTEMNKSKHEIQSQFKERIMSQENELQDLRKLPPRIESLQQDKSKLTAQIRAQESVIEGLRTERKLWGQELAQQGASLAQDRGRLESKVESLVAEVRSLTKQNEDNLDTIKIKSKLIEDQTESIKKLKQGVQELEKAKEKAKEEIMFVQNDLEDELNSEKTRNQELQDMVDKLTTRKGELKDELTVVKAELEQLTIDKKELTSKWNERSDLISKMEEKVIKVKESFDAKEKKLKQERDDATKQLTSCSDKLRRVEDSFKRELDKKQQEHDLEFRKMIASKDTEVQSMKQKVNEVEEEMRLLLRETNETKRNLEAKISRLGEAFLNIKQDLSS